MDKFFVKYLNSFTNNLSLSLNLTNVHYNTFLNRFLELASKTALILKKLR